MGPSGAGKSSMLDVIAGRNKAFTGHVKVNGEPWNPTINKHACYVLQDDVFYYTLTVEEHLQFQAQLRMGKAYTPEQRNERVQFVIDELGLRKCKYSPIGNSVVRGISGGERKRLSFATELLTNPSLLFVDEPTSGLDSFMAESVVQQMQKLAREGRTVLTAIHQPSSQLFSLFDSFRYFMKQIIQLDPEATKRVDRMVALWEDKTASSVEPTPVYASMQELSTHKGSHLGVWDQTTLLIQRNVTRLVRDRMAFRARFFQSIFISVIVGLVYLQLDMDQTGIQSFSGVLFFIVINQVMMPASSRATTWYLAKNVSELAFQIFFPIVFLIPLYFMIGFGPSNASVFFSLYVFIVLLLNSTATGLGYMVSCMVRRADLDPVIGIVMLLPLVLFGGLFINADDTPDYLVWLVYISPFKYGYRGIMRAFWTSVTDIPCIPAGRTCVQNGLQVLENASLDSASMAVDVGALLAVNLGFRLLGLFFLAKNIKKRD
ncbi:hypothetical protein AC1031_005637 [Aphanomyces cochlioides]|nr:hypothetical protein AC1031_005637 [Aphanomyces cochlioides]